MTNPPAQPSLRSVAVLLPALALLATPPGAGVAASYAFDALRRRFPPADVSSASRLRRAGLWLLHAPLGARLSMIVLPILIAVPSAVLLALVTGQDAWNAADVALAALLSPLVAAVTHGLRHLGRELPAPTLAPTVVAISTQPLRKRAARRTFTSDDLSLPFATPLRRDGAEDDAE